MTGPTADASLLSSFYADGERLGWTFRDRNLFRYRFMDPYPVLTPVDPSLIAAAKTASEKRPGRMALAGGLGIGFAVLLGCCGGIVSKGLSGGGPSSLILVLAVLSFVAGVGAMVMVGVQTGNAKAAVATARDNNQRQYDADVGRWQARGAAHDQTEQARVDTYAEWGTADPPPGTRRVDVIGGNIWGWEALLTVFGGSLLRTRGAMTLVDFTGESACRELVRLAEATGTSFDVKLLPAQLPETNLLAGLEPRQIVDTLIESMYGDSAGASRADRAQDDRILTAVCDALNDDITMARLAAALRVLMGEPRHDALTEAERDHIANDLFADDFKRQVNPNLRRIESYLHPLEDLGSRVEETRPAMLTCLIDESDGRSARRELLKDLTIQWLTRRVSAQNLPARSIVIVGADEVSHLHIERLTDLCERRDIRLVLFFRHLRDAAVRTIGGGAVCFMRLPNHEEARQAAEFIGKQHKFTLSRLTRTIGGDETHTVEDSDGGTTGKGGAFSPAGYHRNWTVSRNWNQTVSQAESSNWTDSVTEQRVYEYAVEPRALQDLPDYALLLVKGQGSGTVLQPVECNPAIIMLPRSTMQPLPDIPLPDPAYALMPTADSTVGQINRPRVDRPSETPRLTR